MGLDYSYEIFLPSRDVGRALTRLAELAPRGRDTPPLRVTLPGGEQLTVPFTSNFKSEPVDCSAGGTLQLDTSIAIGVDDAVREFFLHDSDGVDEQGRVPVGYIYLTVGFSPAQHPNFASLQFTAATSRMSRMFARSASARKTFTDLTAAIGGVCCLLDTETDVLDICWLNGGTLRGETVPGTRFSRFHDLVATWHEPAEQNGTTPARGTAHPPGPPVPTVPTIRPPERSGWCSSRRS
ncbi:hypothetical protein ACIQBJ_32705 [Kitasatospora sp. NPDC088391]|uniref:hypothetical protein n=1 Tax=Kitasatospora sp. NPDC088391 TaxID=3364074 RepID=UPI0037FD5F2D